MVETWYELRKRGRHGIKAVLGHSLKTCQLQTEEFIRQVTRSHKWIQAGEGYKPGDIQLEKTVQVPRCATGGGGERTAEQRWSLQDLSGIKAEGKTQQIRKACTPTQKILLHVTSQIMPPTRPLQTPRILKSPASPSFPITFGGQRLPL